MQEVLAPGLTFELLGKLLIIRRAQRGHHDAMIDQGVRVAGRVARGSLVKHTSAKGTEMTFAIGDFKGPGEDAGETVTVAYTGIVPDMFAEGRDVIIEGRYADGTLRAQQIMTSCPSKYEPKPGEAPASDVRASN